MDTIPIQAAGTDHAKAILAVVVASFAQYRDKLDPPSGVFKETPQDIAAKIHKGGAFAAYDGKDMVGAVLYEPKPAYMYLGRLAVLPAYRGRRIATRLVAVVEQKALELNLSAVQLGVRVALTDNLRLFQELGYQVIGQHSHQGYTEITYLMLEKQVSA